MHIQQTPSHILHLLLSLVTVGLWIPIWIIVALNAKPLQCTQCGKKRSASPIARALGG